MTMMQNENPNIGTSIVDDMGKPMRVVAVYSAALKYLTNHLLEALAATMRGVTVQWINENFKIKWVIPHPGNWGDQTKQILRVAAKQIGIPDLCLVTEAEAASYYCQVLPFHRDQHLDEKRFESQGTVLCSDIFQQHLAVGQEVRIGEFSSKTTIFINRRDQRYLSIPVFLSTVDTSLYTTETTCHYLGRMKITLVSDRHEKAPVTIKMALTYSELIVEVVDEGSGRTIRDVFSDTPAVE
ncbi:hypothetical protein FSP39_011703 [Pinctada imbricata]|uniref:Uncharacterized protein n=1 Tax=Pinctada imbricata TaxID=66713 RepID=A0AA88Y8A1_PINIB|nr:hypothetical protein FSP39_011703 [Pinctada imbricata]